MKIGFYLDNGLLTEIDFRRPWEGNPGIGASAFMQVAVPYFMQKYGDLDEQQHIFAKDIRKLPAELVAHKVESIYDAVAQAKTTGIDYFAYRPTMGKDDEFFALLEAVEQPVIGVGQLTPKPDHLRAMAKCRAFKALVCVGREQYDYLMDSPIYQKLAYIDNGVLVESKLSPEPIEKDPRLVVYMGAMVPQKGFHVLAEAWPKVLARVPDAKLEVIGSARIYNQDAELGALGVASENYEQKMIRPFLSDSQGQLLPSVTFHGQMASEKNELLCRAMVGVANPTGQTETCCVAAVEMAACKTAVVSGAYYALLDTVRHGETGLLGQTVEDLAANIVYLLQNPDRAIELGEAGHSRTVSKYDFSVVAPKWIELFGSLDRGKLPKPDGQLRNLSKHFKFLRMVNRLPQRSIGRILFWPSMQELEFLARRLLSFRHKTR